MMSHKKQAGFSLIELLVVVAIMLVVAAIAIPAAIASSQAGNETSAASTLRAAVTAETAYEKLYGLGYSTAAVSLGMTGAGATCPNTPDPAGLTASCLLADNVAGNLDAGNIGGFAFKYTPVAGGVGYTITAQPTSTGKGRKSYIVDQTGSIFYKWGSVAPAAANAASGTALGS